MRKEVEECEVFVRDLAVQGDAQDQLAQSLLESLGQVDVWDESAELEGTAPTNEGANNAGGKVGTSARNGAELG
eukprot:4101751-Pyramimonas_sp.AAC.1